MKESYAIETRHLTKRYGEQVAVNDVCLHVPKGHIYGLLGRNGAGKTSIMKLILQLMPATSGETLLFGEPVKRRERGVFQRIGAIIETPGFYPNLTGTENLEIFAKLRGTIRPDAVEHALQVVGLPYKDKKLFGEYSLGMKQLSLFFAEGADKGPNLPMAWTPSALRRYGPLSAPSAKKRERPSWFPAISFRKFPYWPMTSAFWTTVFCWKKKRWKN